MWEFFFDVDSVVTKSGISFFFAQSTTHHSPLPPRLCRLVLIVPALRLMMTMMICMPVIVLSALSKRVQAIVICSSINRCQVGEQRTTFSLITNSQLYIDLVFVNTDPQTVEKSLGIKNATKKKGIITDDEDGGTSEQVHKENNKKKRPSISGAFPFTFLVYFTDIEHCL